ncbi:RnfABCDGE type electron transport complex subunit G [Muricomes intestini]|jgi:electron transport complex protein RnfG|uniref:Ion-translocating oxidoreductase complex subunit G n=1 Tax=Muricomes intestini TaxID=1796634 RepID=A0A4R3K7Z0_9FIRM|nr:RnfABCDGE type electron transport complex subunit G [Muricomes intestini]TCS79106.1 electron transport complex protein RnfG [Muricomes intestini]HAX52607.1 FMN-binding protein [Lachnospiraceae bacterium]HCR82377.1 FMN-binding protein [Lachnospiraceae bacterium]
MNKIVKNTLILTAITLISGILLGLVYEVTKAPIATAQEKARQEAYKDALPDAVSFESYDDFDESGAAQILKSAGYSDDDVTATVIGKDEGGNDIGCVITVVSHEGYGGDIILSVGILADGTVKGVEILDISETAGLGMKASEADFRDQFKDKQVESFSYTKNNEKGDDKIDAISGATITTNAVTNAVDSALIYFQNTLGGSVNE